AAAALAAPHFDDGLTGCGHDRPGSPSEPGGIHHVGTVTGCGLLPARPREHEAGHNVTFRMLGRENSTDRYPVRTLSPIEPACPEGTPLVLARLRGRLDGSRSVPRGTRSRRPPAQGT